MAWWETLVPFGLIGAAICLMGGSQYAAQMYFVGKPKPIGQDAWDRRLELRDQWLAEVKKFEEAQKKE